MHSKVSFCFYFNISRYNNKTYRIDDIEWDQNPTNTFPLKNGEAISYVQYYKSQYNIEIKNLKQPLLISHKKVRVFGKKEKETQTCSIIPEISYLTGLTDEQRSDFRVRFKTIIKMQDRFKMNKFKILVNFCRSCEMLHQLHVSHQINVTMS